MSNYIIIFAIIDFSNFIVSNFIDVLQKKIDKIAFLRKTLRKAKIDEKIEFCIFVGFDEIFILLIRFESNAKPNREKFYRMINSKKYFDKNQQNFEQFLRKCIIAFQINFYIYKKNLIRVIYAQAFVFDRFKKNDIFDWMIKTTFKWRFWNFYKTIYNRFICEL